MKIISILCLSLLATFTVTGQTKLEVSFDKSVMLVFDSPVKPKGWSCGQKELVSIAVQENKMILQAKEEQFDETNLILELENGTIYAFDLVYNNAPKNFFYVIKSTQASYVPSQSQVTQTQKQPTSNESSSPKQNKPDNGPKKDPQTANSSGKMDLFRGCEKIIHSPDEIKRIGIIKNKMYLYVGGIFVEEDKLFFKVNIKNVSSVPYDVDYTQFLVRNVKSGLSRNVSPQVEKYTPVYTRQPESVTINQNEIKTWVFVFDKFTIAEDKKLFIEFFEKNGERSLEITVEYTDILNAKSNL